jgi:hypothetical protein
MDRATSSAGRLRALDKAGRKIHRVYLRRRRTDGFLIAHPKSGTTWLRLLLGTALCDAFGRDRRGALKEDLTRELGLPRMLTFYDGTTIRDGLTHRELEAELRRNRTTFDGRNVLFMARDPRDILVSHYFHGTRRIRGFYGFHGSLSQFIRSEQYGIRKVLTFYHAWAERRDRVARFLTVHYEDLHLRPQHTLRQALDFLGATKITDDVVSSAISFGRFQNMRLLEAEDFFGLPEMRPEDRADPESYKVRQGRIGGYRRYLSEHDADYLNETIAEIGNPFARHQGMPCTDRGIA